MANAELLMRWSSWEVQARERERSERENCDLNEENGEVKRECRRDRERRVRWEDVSRVASTATRIMAIVNISKEKKN